MGKVKVKKFLAAALPLLLVGVINSCALKRDNLKTSGSSREKLFLWQIDCGNKTSFILGSIHFLKKEFFPLAETIENAFSNSSTLAVETLAPPGERIAAAMKKGVYGAGEPYTLENRVSEKTYRLLEAKLQSYHMDIQLFRKFKPWYMAQTLALMEIMAKGYQPQYGIDTYFLEKARGKKPVIALEKLDEQLDFYDALPPGVNEAYLLSCLEKKSNGTANNSIEPLTAAWLCGDDRAINRLLIRTIKKEPRLEALYEKLIYQRNRNMAQRIASLLKTSGKNYFFVVGATHLVGKRGIIQLLIDRGFQVNRL